MKTRSLARLDLLAAERAVRQTDIIRQAEASVARAGQQCSVLAGYRDRLVISWQDGAVVSVGQARRAAQFSAASEAAARQLAAAAEQALARAAAAGERLAEVTAQRKILAEAMRRERREAARLADRRAERDVQYQPERQHPKPGATRPATRQGR